MLKAPCEAAPLRVSRRVRRTWILSLVGLLLAGCTPPPGTAARPQVSPQPSPSRAARTVAVRHRPAPPQRADHIDLSSRTDSSGATVEALLRVDQRRERVVWHPGTVVPGGTGWPTPDRLVGAELRQVLATFNGGFTNVASRGATWAGGRQHGALRVGAASFVIDSSGRADVRAWTTGPSATRGLLVVRQNLDLLVADGRAASTVGQDDSPVWGRGLHHRHATWRTAVGIDRDGRLLVVEARNATTRQLATWEVAAGARRAMELDINPQFSCLLVYRHTAAGPVPHAVLTGQQGSVLRYLSPSRRDFFSVLPRG